MTGSSVPQYNYTTLANRLSQPESKKARKRRRKAERQALEDARLQNLNWLNGHSPFASGVPILPPRSWSSDVQMYGGYPAPQSSLSNSGFIVGHKLSPLSSSTALPGPDDFTLYDNLELHSASPPPPPSRWVSSMAKAAAIDRIDPEERDTPSQWSPSSVQIPLPPLPPSLPPPLPPQATNIPDNTSRLNILPKPVEHHALPPKPQPVQTPPKLQPVQTTIGMKPDQDPNSKHGIFQLASATREAGTNVRKGPLYMPNPARTLVMEQLPKTHRNPEFINKWSKSACGTLAVHMFIDHPGGKALIEFATAELARKAWASPKLRQTYGYPVKGTPREDLIKVWWYRVDGVGAGSGVGEIEEGEIEDDAIEKEVDQPFRKETKKEKKARLAKEREEKRAKRELELRLIQERNGLLMPQVEPATSLTNSFTVPEDSSQRASPPLPLTPWPPARQTGGWPIMEWNRASPKTGDDRIVSWDTSSTWSAPGQADDLDDYDSNMEIDDHDTQLPSPTYPAVQPLPLHSSLPPRPAPNIVAPLPRLAVQIPPPPPLPPPPPPPPPPPTDLALPILRPVYETIPRVAPTPEINLPSGPSSSPPTPSEPRAIKNAPTEPSFTKRALMARQKELEERIAKSKLELAEMGAATVSDGKPMTPVSSVQLADDLVKPSMDLGEKQAMEDRLRKLVLQSQRARGKAGPGPDNNNGTSNVLAAPTVSPGDVSSTSPSISASSSSSSSQPSPVVPSNQLPLAPLTTASVSTHNFSLEDLAISFITQTIETIKSQPAPTLTPTTISVQPSNKPASTTQPNNNNTTKLELAAKQRRLEQHITESKNLMAKLSQARTKEEKDAILKAMREMSRCVSISPLHLPISFWLSLSRDCQLD